MFVAGIGTRLSTVPSQLKQSVLVFELPDGVKQEIVCLPICVLDFSDPANMKVGFSVCSRL